MAEYRLNADSEWALGYSGDEADQKCFFESDNNPGAGHTTSANGKRCIFFKFPAEVRLEIYKHVVGRNFIHVEANWQDWSGIADLKTFSGRHGGRAILEECRHDGAMEAGVYSYMIGTADHLNINLVPGGCVRPLNDDSKTYFYVRHCDCLIPANRPYKGLDLRFLRTCKGIYEEAKYIYLREMTFSFRSPTVFDTFVISTNKFSLANIRSLHFDISLSHEMEDWGHSLEGDAVAEFPSLQRLYIWIDFASSLQSTRRSREYMQSFDADVYYKRPFCMFRMCPLKEVRVVLNPGVWPNRELPDIHISWEDIRAWCKGLEKRLLLKWDGPIDLLDA
ncbi:hypothetical protein TWF730_008973 [Orbilia blumenaviensis]|uniref:Uncharacterized protein n=1 Tax=Orbilia blumenaviensis TaxID=1796055 RepID=A0AAV9V3K4_9PEZI